MAHPHNPSKADELAVAVGPLLRQRGWTLAVAESCTGGLLAHHITNVPGSSDYFLGGIVSYANAVKQALLDVSEEVLQQQGAVSSEVAQMMARGVRLRLQSDVGVGITGIAGPGGDQPGKPVGLVFIAVATPATEVVERHVWNFDRIGNKEASAAAALEMLCNCLKSP